MPITEKKTQSPTEKWKMILPVISEDQARLEKICRGCGDDKPSGNIVCWACFKGGNNETNPLFVPLKYYGGSFEAWQTETWGRKI